MAVRERSRVSDRYGDEQSRVQEGAGVPEKEGDQVMVVLHAWESLIDTLKTRASEWMLGGAMISLGLTFRFNTGLFDSSAAFNAIKEIASQDYWAWGCLLVGACRVIVLLINGMWWPTPIFRALLALLSCFVWFKLGFAFGSNFSIVISLLPWLFLLDAYNGVRVGHEAGMIYFQEKGKGQDNGTKL
jgi:hypothetical protein